MSDQLTNIKFVEEVKKHAVLYNYYLPGYSRRDVTEKAWNNVGNEVNMTVVECKEKWRNLRTVFARYMKLRPSGSRAAKRKAYYLADVMQFAIPFIKTSALPSSGNVPEVPEADHAQLICPAASDALSYSDEGCDDHEENRLEISSSPIPPPVELRTAPSTTVHVTNQETEKYESSKKKYKTTAKQTSELEAKIATPTYLNPKKLRLDVNTTQGSSENERKEALRMFLLSLMPELLNLNDGQIKIFKHRVLSLIDDIELLETNSVAPAPMTLLLSSESSS